MQELLETLWFYAWPHGWQDWAVYVMVSLALAFAGWCAWSLWIDRDGRNFWV